MQTISVPNKQKIEPVSIAAGKHLIGEFIGNESRRNYDLKSLFVE